MTCGINKTEDVCSDFFGSGRKRCKLTDSKTGSTLSHGNVQVYSVQRVSFGLSGLPSKMMNVMVHFLTTHALL